MFYLRCVVTGAIWLISVTLMTAAVARQGEWPLSWRLVDKSLTDVPVAFFPAVDSRQRLAEDASLENTAPLRFAQPLRVAVNPADDGVWQDLNDGDRLWRYRVHVPGATDLNFGFSRYRLPAGATLHIYSETERYYEGPYNAADNKPHGQFWTPVVPGESAVIELYLPAGGTEDVELQLTQIGAGYRDLFGRQSRVLARQGGCNIDTICPEGDSWRDQIRSVARYTRNGVFLCTGSLIMDVPRSFRPFFLTAAHCGVNTSNDATVVVYWNFESPACGQLGGGSLADNQTGASFRAAEADVDVALIELDATPDPAFNVFYSGWDRSGTAVQGSVGIHHPGGDEKAISFNSDTLQSGGSCIGNITSNTHWYVDDWEQGTTEAGSSGSALFDPVSKRIVGFLSGGTAACRNQSGFDCYGKFSVAWDKGQSALSRLSDWLDPTASGVIAIDGAEPGELPPVFDDHFE